MSTMQSLTLSVQGERAERLGARREHEFGCRDGSIGRSDECDWVLGAEGVSRLHALVRYVNGLYFIEDRSTNGMLLNGTSLQRGEPVTLKHGDRLQIDTFVIDVHMKGETATQWNALNDNERTAATAAAGRDSVHSAPSLPAASSPKNVNPLDLSLLLASRGEDVAVAQHGEAHGGGLIPGAADAAPGAILDPLAMFDAPSSYGEDAQASPPPNEGWNHTPAVSDRFHPPQVEAVRASAPLLPDDWDVMSSHVASRVESRSNDSPLATPAQMPREVPASQPHASAPERLAEGQPELQSLLQSQAQPQSSAEAPSAKLAVHQEQALQSPTPAKGPTSLPNAAHPHATAPASAASRASAAAPPSPELDEMLHIAVDTMMDVLRARAELKNSFRLPATLIQRAENNPLKFAPTAQEAVKKLFAPPDQGFLCGSAALNDAATDIRNHQMAMLAGVRAAFDSMLAQFDPARIEETEGVAARRLSFGGRPSHWERYKVQFDALTRNPDECFQRLFGDEFARAYEAQLARLKHRRD